MKTVSCRHRPLDHPDPDRHNYHGDRGENAVADAGGSLGLDEHPAHFPSQYKTPNYV